MTDATTMAGLLTQRATAGARYTAAVQELHDAFIDLAALDKVDLALAYKGVAGHSQVPVRTYASFPETLPENLIHPIFAPRASGPRWETDVEKRRAALAAALASVT